MIDVTFKLDEEYTFSYFFNQGLMHNRCSRPKPNVLFIDSFEPKKLWNLTSEMVFTKYGMINTQTIVQVWSLSNFKVSRQILRKTRIKSRPIPCS